jgi:transposase
MAARDGAGERRRTRSLDERKRIVVEALAPGASVAAVARRHGLNANLIFKWIRRSREGWRDRRREPANEKPVVVVPPEGGAPAFIPVKLLELDAASAPPRSDVAAKPARQTRRGVGRGAMEISLPNGAKVSLDADVDAEALRRVLSALGVA